MSSTTAPKPNRRDPENSVAQYRDEIEQRTAHGESCEAIASALRARGYQVHAKTISRWRINWGLRKRVSSTVGRTYPGRKRKVLFPEGVPDFASRRGGAELRKKEIVQRTERGESAEEIAAALTAKGFELRKGASTIWRLQTTWGLIPYSDERARGKGVWNKKKTADKAARAAARDAAIASGQPLHNKKGGRRQKQIEAPSNPTETHFYPAECANGPNGRYRQIVPQTQGSTQDQDQDQDQDQAQEQEQRAAFVPEPLPEDTFMSDDDSPAAPINETTTNVIFAKDLTPGASGTSSGDPVNVAAEIMSAELLVNLATSTLAAAEKVKELYLALQTQRPAPGSTTGLPPTVQDIADAKKKVEEAAAVMHDLSLPGMNSGVRG